MSNVLEIPMPTAKQKQFISAKQKYCMFGGARGGGKSFGVDISVNKYGWTYPGIRQLIIRKTYPELMENHIKPLKAMLQVGSGKFARYNDQRKEMTLVNGSTILFRYCDTVKDLDRFQGLEVDILYIDEATHHTEEVWDKLKAIVRGANSFPKRIYLTCNPGGPGMSWVKRLFIDRNFKENENPDDYCFIQSLLTDNKPLMAANPDYMKQLESLPPKLRAAWLDGDWNILEGQFFEELRLEPDIRAAVAAGCSLSKEELLQQRRWTHVIEPFDLNSGEARGWTIFRSYDFGYGKPWSCAWWAVDYDGVMYRVAEYYGCTDTPNEGRRLTPDEQAREIARYENEHPWFAGRKIVGVADPAIWDASRGESVADTFVKHGVIFTPGDNNRIAGWMQVHYRLQFDENGYPRMYIFNTCKDFIRTMPLLMYDEHKSEDLDTDLEDHIADETRYACMSRPITPIRPVEEKPRPADPLDQYKNIQFRRY